MEKKKIAESIIIRVGGGIREIRREPVEMKDVIHTESDFEQPEEMHSFQSEPGATSGTVKNKTVN